MTKYRLDEEDIELENSSNYDDNNSDYNLLELVQESINENLFLEIVNEEAFQLSENNQLLDDSTKFNFTYKNKYPIKQHNLRRKKICSIKVFVTTKSQILIFVTFVTSVHFRHFRHVLSHVTKIPPI